MELALAGEETDVGCGSTARAAGDQVLNSFSTRGLTFDFVLEEVS